MGEKSLCDGFFICIPDRDCLDLIGGIHPLHDRHAPETRQLLLFDLIACSRSMAAAYGCRNRPCSRVMITV